MGRRQSSRRSRERLPRSTIVNAVALLVALPALGYSFYIDAPASLAENAERLMADSAVSMSASVPANPYNTLAQQLTDKQTQLDQEQASLNAEEAAARNSPAEYLGIASLCLSIFLLLLVGLNFYFDMRRKSPPRSALEKKFLVDLR